MQIVFQMRYSFFGRSGWKSKTRADPGLLFAPDRLAERGYLVEKLALAGLKAQSDTDFKLVVLSSEGLPDPEKARLRTLFFDMLGEDRVTLRFDPPAPAPARLLDITKDAYGDTGMRAQVVLDDDDSLSTDFVGRLRTEAEAGWQAKPDADNYFYLSFARGLSLVFADGTSRLFNRNVPFTNLGLALISDAGTKRNPYATAHKRIGLRHPARVIYSREHYYIRGVHGHNDSRALVRDAQIEENQVPGIIERFPYLTEVFADRPLQHPDPEQSDARAAE